REKILSHGAKTVPKDMADYAAYLNGLQPDEPPMVITARKLVVAELQAVLLTGDEYTWNDIRYAKKDALIQMVCESFQQDEDLQEHIQQHDITKDTAENIAKARKPARNTRPTPAPESPTSTTLTSTERLRVVQERV